MLKRSELVMSGNVIKEARKEHGLSQSDLGEMTGYSRQSIGFLENNKVKVTEEFARAAIKGIDCPVLHMELAHELLQGASSPVLRGKNIERHRLALKELAIAEVEEAMEHLNNIRLLTPPEHTTSREREAIVVMLEEMLDAIAGLQNLKAKLAKEYKISIPKLYEKRKPVWKARGWI